MKEKNFLDTVMDFEQQLESMQEQFRDLKTVVARTMEEHHALQLENHHLRARLDELNEKVPEPEKVDPVKLKKPSWISAKATITWRVYTTKATTSATSISAAPEKATTACFAYRS